MDHGAPGFRLLRDALVALSLPHDEQARVNSPGCLACDLLTDFGHARGVVMGDPGALSEEQRLLLDRINASIETLAPEDYECFNDAVVQRPATTRSSASAKHSTNAASTRARSMNAPL